MRSMNFHDYLKTILEFQGWEELHYTHGVRKELL